jgi:serine/threonine protein kinase/Flp pilus assembly protein TadD
MAAQNNGNYAVVLQEALTRFVDECLQGSKPDIDEFAGQYPQCETQLKRRIRDLKEIDFLFDSLVHADETEFGATTALQDLVGQKLARFDVERVIGQGGMGVVYLARDTKLDRHVAIKSMPAGLLSSSKAQASFKSEAKLLASLNHPNIAVIYEIIEDQEGASYLILEYVPGETLAERIVREPLKLEDALSIGGQIAEAVSAAHKKGIVHRDLKPGNIKITPEGRVKVLDFGLAKTYDRDSKGCETAAIQSGRVIGTPAYMSPEQAQGKETDHCTDIWSFGCVMYEMLTGRHPFECETAKDTMERIIKSQPDWNLLPESTPSNIRTLLRRCLEKDTNQRLGNIADAVIEINETLNKPQTTLTAKLLRTATIFSAMILIILFAIALRLLPNKQAVSPSKEIRLVVLPFENLGPAEDEYFSDGITDEITARLAGIHGLGVISRQSAMQYKKSEKNAQQIASELGVDYILEGTIQCEHPSDPNSRVKIRPQLIRASNDMHLWAEVYNDDMSKIFSLQSNVAERVVQALNITLLGNEQKSLQSEPTKNMEAYVFYLRGNEYSSRPYQNRDNLVIAIEMYEMAIKLDDQFALAHARLSHAHSGMYKFRHDRSEERLKRAWEESDIALKLDPELPEAHWARGVYHYWCRLEYDLALKELEIARKSQPNNSRFLSTIGYVQRRQGQFEPTLANIKKAFELSPVDYRLAYELGGTLRNLRRYQEAEYYYDKAISLAPNEDLYHFVKATLYLIWKGSTVEARAVLDNASKYFKLEDKERFVNLWFDLDIIERNYQGALARLPLKSTKISDSLTAPNSLRYARIYGYMNKKELADKYYIEAVENLESEFPKDPNNVWFHSALGIAYAGLGHKEKAIREGKKPVELFPYAKHSAVGFNAAKDLAIIYTMVGEYDAAIDQIEYLLSVPGESSISLLRCYPTWDPLRNHPRFKKLIEQD